MMDKYTWVDIGSSYLMNEISAAYLWGQLEKVDEILKYRLDIWKRYYEELFLLAEGGFITLPTIPEYCSHNAHMFYIKVKNLEERTALLEYLKNHGIWAVFHYVPLHSSPAGRKFGKFHEEDPYTTRESERLIRLPLYYGLKNEEVEYIIKKIKEFYHETK